MGLDQYLYEERYLSHYDHNKGSEEYAQAEKVLEVTGLQHDPSGGGVTVRVAVIYWRKANMIHKWIMDHCYEKVGDVEYEVTRENLIELRDTCQRVLEESEMVTAKVIAGQRLVDGGWQDILEDGQVIINPQVAIDLLPTTDGFFFGSTEYDQWYVKDLERTIESIDRVLAQTEAGWFEYYASW